MEQTASICSSNGSLDLDEHDRQYLEALNHEDHIVTKNTRRPLGLFSVVAFILQQVIGTGIYRTPWTVMQATRSVGVTMLFWLCGAFTAVAGTIIFIEFGLTLPRHTIDGKTEPVVRNGGDLNYVSYLLKRPRYLVLCIYGLNFILLASGAPNALSFGDDIVGAQGSERSAKKDALARMLAMVAITLPCLLHAFTRRGGIVINNVFVVIKLAMVCSFPAMAIYSVTTGNSPNYARMNMNSTTSFANIHSDVDSYTQGFLAVIYAYGGYNQASYILCEIDKPRKNFVRGIIIAVTIVCVLYALVNISYMVIVSKEQQLQTSDVALQFLINIVGEKKAPLLLASFTAVSSFGYIIGQTFTASRVKQEIAKEGVVPFAKFFGENRTLFGRFRSSKKSSTCEPTPLGALFLHWSFAIFLVLVTWPVKPAYAYRILVGQYSYIVDVVPSTVMAVGLLILRFSTNWSSKSPMPSWLSVLAAFVYLLANGFPLIAVWVPPAKGAVTALHDIIPGTPWYLTGLLSWSLLLCGVLYWLFFRYVLPRIGARKGKEFVVEREPVFRTQNGERVQWHEIVLHSWVVKREPEKRPGYVLDGP